MHSVADEPRARRLRELATLAGVMARFWLVVFPLARGQLRLWEQAAGAIPDPELRAQALATIRSERLSAAGAALFAATVGHRDPALVRALVAFQVACDYLDTLSEQPVRDPIGNGGQLHRALGDAIDGEAGCVDYYRLHRARDDGGYLAALVAACRESSAALPAFEHVRKAAAREARRNEVQGINHAPAALREPALRRWALAQGDDVGDARWFELAAAGSSSLAVLALLAAAADPATTEATAELVRNAYFPWIEALSTLLDSVADREHDAASGELSFVSQYASAAEEIERLRVITARALAGARRLPHGERHVVLVAGMVAMHLSEATAWLPTSAPATLAVLRAAQTTAMPLLLALLRTWRLLASASSRRAERHSARHGPALTSDVFSCEWSSVALPPNDCSTTMD
jgi:tetraprenyl-beta-curcumene synthase